MSPPPLPPDTVLAERFALGEVLGRGGFSIAYLARDLDRREACVVKELAPRGALRAEDGVLELAGVTAADPRMLRQRFLEEAQRMGKLSAPGVLPVRCAFVELGTAYYVTDHLWGATPLDRLIPEAGMDSQGVLDVIFQLMETLEAVHETGLLHRDIKPSNILLDPRGQAYLIDFGAAREWEADLAQRHTILFTPGYAPLEQLSEHARRGPATDVYALCATAYHMLTGTPPTSATDRAAGVELQPLRELRSDLDPRALLAITSGLSLAYEERPPTMKSLRALFERTSSEEGEQTVASYDRKALELQRLRFGRRECPGCRSVLDTPKPLRRGVCPVCRSGPIQKRRILEGLCPLCKVGGLRRHHNATCPVCGTGLLQCKKKRLLGGSASCSCPECRATVETAGELVTVLDAPRAPALNGVSRSSEAWRAETGRAEETHVCSECAGQWDEQSDGRLKQIHPKPTGRYSELYPDEWSRLAAGLDPGAGNAECRACGADFYLEEPQVTLLGAPEDPHGFAERNLGRLLDLDQVRWLAVGKESSGDGFVCYGCDSEWDTNGHYLRLVRSENLELNRHIGRPYVLEDWHRVARGLPRVDEEEEFQRRLDSLVVEAFASGEIDYEIRAGLMWRSQAVRLEEVDDHLNEVATGPLAVSEHEIVFGSLMRKWRMPMDAVLGADAQDDILRLRLSGEREHALFELPRLEVQVDLESGPRRVTLGARDLAARINSVKNLQAVQ
jgi:serine/threonine protein kinase